MRKPNGYGSVIKLSGNRRKPYAVRITVKWEINGETAVQKYKYIGYYRTLKEAEIALADYNKNPFIIADDITFAELYERYSSVKYNNLSENTVNVYTSAYRSCKDLFDIPISKLNLKILQGHMDNSDRSKPTLKLVKALWSCMFDFAIRNDWLPPERKAIIHHVDISDKGTDKPKIKVPFSHEEIEMLWKHTDDLRVQYVLVLIYTGLRISEMLSLTPDDIHLSEQYLDINKSKTAAGIRKVPIADKILSLNFIYEHGYQSFLKYVWNPCMSEYGLNHTPHEARHTCISLLSEKEVDQRIVKAIVGHSGSGVTEQVYTHISIRKLLDAINQI